jgi:hypothetical protein
VPRRVPAWATRAFLMARAQWRADGFVCGDPERSLHGPGHPHRAPGGFRAGCPGCAPQAKGVFRLVLGGAPGDGLWCCDEHAREGLAREIGCPPAAAESRDLAEA